MFTHWSGLLITLIISWPGNAATISQHRPGTSNRVGSTAISTRKLDIQSLIQHPFASAYRKSHFDTPGFRLRPIEILKWPYSFLRQHLQRSFRKPTNVIINNHRPFGYVPNTVINNHSPLSQSTIRPLPLNDLITTTSNEIGFTPPQLLVPSSYQDSSNGADNIISSNALAFIEKPLEDTTIIYSDVIVMKKPSNETGNSSSTFNLLLVNNKTNEDPSTTSNETTTDPPQTQTTEVPTTSVSTISSYIQKPTNQQTSIAQATSIVPSYNNPPQVQASYNPQTSVVSFAGSVVRPTSSKPLSLLFQNSLIQRLRFIIPSALIAIALIIALSLL